ncbi:WD40 repeat-like protein [Mycena venus]|uniref:WD40 repeat-like protein n=1 Tax=Mycena venus TaxID=2733690 RepID=A0A8H6Z0H7_9AGAR|nr:WD40 repeat-like protein [Mycena venus]
MVTSGSTTTQGKSVQISSITATLQRPVKKEQDLFLEAKSRGERIGNLGKFKDGSCNIRFDPPHSIENTSILSVQLRKNRLFQRDILLTQMRDFTVQKAQKELRKLGHLTEVNDHPVSDDAVAVFSISFSMKDNAVEDLMHSAIVVADNLKSILDPLKGRYPLIDRTISLGVAVSEANPIAKSVLATVDEIKKLLRDQDNQVKELRDLAGEMAESLHCVAAVRQFANSEALLKDLEEADSLVRNTANFISQYNSFSAIRTLSSILSDKTTGELASLTRRFSWFKQNLATNISAQTGQTIEEMKGMLSRTITDSTDRDEFALLQMLKTGTSAAPRGQKPCMNGDPPTIFWLHGHPGTGKSAIAASVRARLFKKNRLGSIYFFRREDAESQTPEALWCSVAYDLALNSPAIRRLVIEKLKSQEIDLRVSTARDIFDKLVADTLALTAHQVSEPPRVIVIDALDECGGLSSESRSYQEQVLLALARCQSVSLQIKIFVTSRNEANIQRVLGTGATRIRALGVGQSVTQDSSLDIEKYLRRGFCEIRSPLTRIKSPWPTDSDLQLLVDTAAGLFIWATTILRHIEEGNPEKRLNSILQGICSQGMVLDPLVQLYETILDSKFKQPGQIRDFVRVAGTIIAAQTPLSLDNLVELLSPLTWSLDHTDIETICNKLRSLLDTGSDLRFLHQSFPDFLIKLPSNHRFHCNKSNLR